MSHLLECVYGRLSFRQKFENLWLIDATERLNYKIFYEWFKANEDYSIAFGTETEIKIDKADWGMWKSIKWCLHIGNI